MNRLGPLLLVLIVSVLELAYGRFSWSWVAGPVVGLVLWSLRDVADSPTAPAPARASSRPPTGRPPVPVD